MVSESKHVGKFPWKFSWIFSIKELQKFKSHERMHTATGKLNSQNKPSEIKSNKPKSHHLVHYSESEF